MLPRRLAIIGTAAMLVLLAGCGGSSGTAGGTALTQALSRVADTADTRAEIDFDDTAALVTLTGKGRATKADSFGPLRGFGASGLQQYVNLASGQPGINLFSASYTVTAGKPPSQVALIAGGQQPDAITKGLTKIGWKQRGGTLTAPAFDAVGGDQDVTGPLSLAMSRVRTTGSDLAYGQQQADLSRIGSPSGTTLDKDPLISAIADCLGDVVAAQILAPFPGGGKPAALGVGLQQPKTDGDTPHAVVCAAWGTSAQADQYTTAAKQALASGTSLTTNTRYASTLGHPSVDEIGGDEHVVGWNADVTTGGPLRIFSMVQAIDLPALPDCPELNRLPPAARQQADRAHLCT
jgi:hypothetical protein